MIRTSSNKRPPSPDMEQNRNFDVDPPVELPIRNGVGIVLFNPRGQVWTGRRLPKWIGDKSAFVWQLPQGGLMPDEDPLEAAYRELEEETGVRSAEMIAEHPHWLSYELPPELIGVALKGRYRGQRHRWFAMRFWGDDSEINVRPRDGRKAEFDRWAWRPLHALPDLAVSFKQPVYAELVRFFGRYVAPP